MRVLKRILSLLTGFLLSYLLIFVILDSKFNKVKEIDINVDTFKLLQDKVLVSPASPKYKKQKIEGCVSDNPDHCWTMVLVETPAEYKTVTEKKVIGNNKYTFFLPLNITKNSKFECYLSINEVDTSDVLYKQLLTDSIIIAATLEDNLTDVVVKPISNKDQLFGKENIWKWTIKGSESGEVLLKIKSANTSHRIDHVLKIPIEMRIGLKGFVERLGASLQGFIFFFLGLVVSFLTQENFMPYFQEKLSRNKKKNTIKINHWSNKRK